MPGCRTRWASSNPVPPDPSPRLNVIEDPKFTTFLWNAPVPNGLALRLRGLGRLAQLVNQAFHARLWELFHVLQEGHLVVEVVIGAVKPKAGANRPMNSQWPADGIAEVTVLQFVMFRKDFDALGRPGAFDRNSQLSRQPRHQQPALTGQEGLFSENPQVCPAAALLQRRLNALLP